MHLLVSPSTDPFVNLSLEELIAQDVSRPTLLVWRNDDAVIIGRNQNPWKECNFDYMRRNGIVLCRRNSGGGTVFHDAGNINITFLYPRKDYDKDKQRVQDIKVVQNILQTANISSTISNSSDILVDGRKVSGSAFRITRHYAYHHLTLLVNANIERLRASLQTPAGVQIEGNFVPSRRASVMNLADVNPRLDWDYVLTCMSTVMQTSPTLLDLAYYKDRLITQKEELQSREWRFYKTPEFSCTLSLQTSGIANKAREDYQITLNVAHGRIQSAIATPNTEYLQAFCNKLLEQELGSISPELLSSLPTDIPPLRELFNFVSYDKI